MIDLADLAAIVAVAGAAVVYGTDVFCAVVLRPAFMRVDEAALVSVAGNVHRFGDRRMPVPGVIGLVGAAVATVSAVVAGETLAATSAGIALAALVVWLVLYVRISAPINRQLTAAADAHATPVNARTLQRDWDRIIVPRAVLQGVAVIALCISLIA